MDAVIEKIADFLAMGGYAGFVWPAYGVAAAILVGMLVAAWIKLKRSETDLERLALRLPGRAAVGSGARGRA